MSDSPQNPGPSSLKIYFRLLGYVKPYIGMFLLSIVGFLIMLGAALLGINSWQRVGDDGAQPAG